MLAVAFPADNIDWGGIHWNPSFLHTGGDHSEARRCFDCSGQKRQSLAALRRCDWIFLMDADYPLVDPDALVDMLASAENMVLPLLLRNKGGPSGAGSVLTSRGQTLLDAYERFENATKENVEKLYEAYLGDVI